MASPADPLLKYRDDYERSLDVFKILVENRFRLLALVPAATAIGVAFIGKNAGTSNMGGSAQSPIGGGAGVSLAVSALGLFAVIAIALYEVRNSQLHDWVVHRLKFLEVNLALDRSTPTRIDKDSRSSYVNPSAAAKAASVGLFNERPNRKWIKHDMALAVVYGASLSAWLALLGRSILQWVQAHWSTLNPATAPDVLLLWLILIAIISIAGGAVSGILIWKASNRNRPQQWPPQSATP